MKAFGNFMVWLVISMAAIYLGVVFMAWDLLWLSKYADPSHARVMMLFCGAVAAVMFSFLAELDALTPTVNCCRWVRKRITRLN